MPPQRNPNKIYNVTLVNEAKGLKHTIKVRGDEYIFDAAEQQGVSIPISCRAGYCITCVAKLVKGFVDQDHDFLKPPQLSAGFILTCKSYPKSDCIIRTHQEDALMNL